MGETAKSKGLPDAAGGCAAGGVAVRLALRRFAACESGATAVEYGLIVTVIFLAIVGAVNYFTSSANGMFNHISSAVSSAS